MRLYCFKRGIAVSFLHVVGLQDPPRNTGNGKKCKISQTEYLQSLGFHWFHERRPLFSWNSPKPLQGLQLRYLMIKKSHSSVKVQISSQNVQCSYTQHNTSSYCTSSRNIHVTYRDWSLVTQGNLWPSSRSIAFFYSICHVNTLCI